MKGVGMLVVSLRDGNFRILVSLVLLGKTPSYLAAKVSFRVARKKKIKIYIYCLCFNMVSF